MYVEKPDHMYYLVTGMYKICQMVIQHFLQAQSGNTLNVLADEDQFSVRTNRKAEAIKAGQETGMVRPISCFASCQDCNFNTV